MLAAIESADVSQALLSYAADVLVQSTLLLLVVILLQLWLRHHLPAFRRKVWLVALIACPFLPLLSGAARDLGMPLVELELLPDRAARGSWVVGAETSVEEFVEGLPPANSHPELFKRVEAGSAINFYWPPRAPEDFPGARIVPVRWSEEIPELGWVGGLLAAGYMIGALALMAVVVVGMVRMVLWLRRCAPVTDEETLGTFRSAAEETGCGDPFFLVEGVPTSGPLTMGYLHPKILVPSGFGDGLDGDELRDIAKHELTHVRHRDPLLFVALASVRAVVFFNPLVWFGIRNIKLLAEQSADWSVAMVRERVLPYTRLLMRMADSAPVKRCPAESVAGFLFGKNVLLKRSEALLSRRGGYSGIGGMRKAIVFAVLLVGLAAALALDAVPARAGEDPAAETRELPAVARLIFGAVWTPDPATERCFLRLQMADGTTRGFEFANAGGSEAFGLWLRESRFPGDPDATVIERGSPEELDLIRVLENWLELRLPDGEAVSVGWEDLDVRRKSTWWVTYALHAAEASRQQAH